MSEHRFGIFYVITRIVLTVLTAIALVGIIVGMIQWLDRHYDHQIEYLVWAIISLLVAITGFYGAWREHFMSCMIYAIVELILLLAGIRFSRMGYFTRISQVCAVVVAFIFSFMLHAGGRADYSMPFNV